MASISRYPIKETILEQRDQRRLLISTLFAACTKIAAGLVGGLAIAMLLTIVVKGAPALSWDFFTKPPLEGMTEGGIAPMIIGSILLMLGTLLLTLPIGVLAGVWLAYYAGHSRSANAVRACIASMAGTPSIIFGLFGLAIFVLKMKLSFCLLAGWMTLTIYSIPVVVLATEQALMAVPQTFEEAAIALGISRWAAIRTVLLPAAMPSVLTGLVLTASRAAGEAPPILLTAGIYYTTESFRLSPGTALKPVMNLPYHLAEGYRQGSVIPEKIIWGTCLTLMLFVLFINLGSIITRAKLRTKQRW